MKELSQMRSMVCPFVFLTFKFLLEQYDNNEMMILPPIITN